MLAKKRSNKFTGIPKQHAKDHPLPMQYLGSKTRIADWIVDQIEDNFGQDNVLIDLFAGTGSVAFSAFRRGYKIVCNDIQPYSYQVLKTLFQIQRTDINLLINLLKNKSGKVGENIKQEFIKLLEIEEEFLSNDDLVSNWEEYAEFSEKVADSNVTCPDEINQKEYNLFINYYANTYFGIRQCLQIDKLREIAESLENSNLRELLLGATISALTHAVTGTTHLAQYLKPTSKRSTKKIIKCRTKDIFELVINRLSSLKEFDPTTEKTEVFNLDFNDSLKKIKPSPGDIIYADPPYFKEHYSRYYHILDTFLLYDFPDLTVNRITGDITSGLYRENRIVSDFGLKSSVADAFNSLFVSANRSNLKIALSYADSSILGQQKLYEIIHRNGLEVETKKVNLLHSSQGSGSNKKVVEYLYLIQ